MKRTLFISDIHLSEADLKLQQRFFDFLKSVDAEALYILGDLFEYWIGEDDQSVLHKKVAAEFKALAKKTKIYFMPGNRDFLISRKWLKKCGVKYLKDPAVVNLYGKRVLLSHGDLFCVRDEKHMYFRKLTQNAFIQGFFLLLPFKARKFIAEYIRKKSIGHKKKQSMAKMDVEMGVVNAYMQKFKADYFIHGHTHKAAIYHYELNGKQKTRVVIGDWEHKKDTIVVFTDQNELFAES